jgi:hypothetical protein
MHTIMLAAHDQKGVCGCVQHTRVCEAGVGALGVHGYIGERGIGCVMGYMREKGIRSVGWGCEHTRLNSGKSSFPLKNCNRPCRGNVTRAVAGE